MRKDFDAGAEVQDQEDTYKAWAQNGEMTALIDGDILLYLVGCTIGEEKAMRHIREMKHCSWDETTVWKGALNHLNSKINECVEGIKGDSRLVFLTGSDNFRYNVAFTKGYKANRQDLEKPLFFHELKDYLINIHEALVDPMYEADDLMSMYQRVSNDKNDNKKELCSTCICSKDKDLRIVPGLHYNITSGTKDWVTELGDLIPVYSKKKIKKYEHWPTINGLPVNVDPNTTTGIDRYKSGKNKGEFKTKRVHVGEAPSTALEDLKGSGLMFFYAQIIKGDQSDNIPGIPGKGDKFAYELLQNCRSEKELYNKVLDVYKEQYGGRWWQNNYRGGKLALTAYQMMLEQGRLLHMTSTYGELWRPESKLPLGDSDAWKD